MWVLLGCPNYGGASNGIIAEQLRERVHSGVVLGKV